MTHFTDRELIEWREHGPGAETDRAIEHMSRCAACATRYAAALRLRPADTVSADDPGDFVRTGQGTAPPWRLPGRTVLALAASLVLAAGILVPFAVRKARTPSIVPQFRSGAIRTLSPVGTVGPDAAFAWSSGLNGARYRIDVGGPDGSVYTMSLAVSPTPLPPDLLSKLTRGVEYWWTITALDSAGQPIGVSERRTFTLRAP